MTIAEIKVQMTEEFISDAEVRRKYSLQDGKTFEEQFSVVSLENIFFFIVATAIWTLQQLFDLHKKEATDTINNLKPHSLRWYANKAKAFQYGCHLMDESDEYNNMGKTEDEIEASKIIAYAAAVEQIGYLAIKVAKEENGNLTPLENEELDAFDYYINRVKDAGVAIEVINEYADELKLSMIIYYDPLVFNNNGQRLDTGEKTIEIAIENYLKNLPFNGEFVLAYLVDALQQVEGVLIPHVEEAWWYRRGQVVWNPISVKYTPYSGYLRLTEEFGIETMIEYKSPNQN